MHIFYTSSENKYNIHQKPIKPQKQTFFHNCRWWNATYTYTKRQKKRNLHLVILMNFQRFVSPEKIIGKNTRARSSLGLYPTTTGWLKRLWKQKVSSTSKHFWHPSSYTGTRIFSSCVRNLNLYYTWSRFRVMSQILNFCQSCRNCLYYEYVFCDWQLNNDNLVHIFGAKTIWVNYINNISGL